MLHVHTVQNEAKQKSNNTIWSVGRGVNLHCHTGTQATASTDW
jgi:hypothetical protein